MKNLFNEIRLFICELLLRLIVHIVPINCPNGKHLIKLIIDYNYIKNPINL